MAGVSEIKERIGDVQGKAASLGNMTWAAHQSGDQGRRDQLYRQAAEARGSARAYLDLITVLDNLGASAEQEREVYAAQAAWLVLRVQAPLGVSMGVLRQLFDLVPKGDSLETLPAAARGENHPQRQKLLEQATQLPAIAAHNLGMEKPEAIRRWYVENGLTIRHTSSAACLPCWNSSWPTAGSSTGRQSRNAPIPPPPVNRRSPVPASRLD